VQKLLQRPRPGKAKLLGSTKKVNVNFQDTDGFSPLHHASLNGNAEVIALLLESQAAVDIRDQKGMRPLHYAAWQGRAEPMKMLLKAGSSVNGQSDEGQIPLHLAAQHGHYDVSEMLLQHQSNPCIVDNAGKTPLDLACEFGRVGVVQLLLSSNMCATLLEPKKGDTTDPNGTSPLHLAAKNGHIDIIRLLIQAGIDINRQTKAGTALHEAALCGKTEAVRLLLECGINAAVRNTYSQTALDIVYQFTATQASREIKQLLRDASAALQVRALKDYCNNYDLTSLNIKAGDVITVLEQHPDGRWKGCIHDNRTGNDRVGYFPSTMVEVISKRTGCRGSEASPHSSPTPSSGPHGGSNEEIWVLRKPVSSEAVVQWLSDCQLQVYASNFLGAGYDLPTISRMTPEDLTAIGITKPGHRKKISSEINKINTPEWLPDQKPDNLGEWLNAIGLSQYHQLLVQNGYENIDFITDITWEDLQEIGITKLGHQKKLMLAVKRLAEIQRGTDGRGSLRKKPPPITQKQEVTSMDSPPPDELMSPKMSTFQDSELSTELQNAMSHPGPEVKSSQSSTSSSHRGSVSSQGKHRHSHSQPAPPYTPPHTPTKTRTSSSSSTSSVQNTAPPQAKPRTSPQLSQGERPQSPRTQPPQSPTHRAPCNQQTQQVQENAQVPLLCLPSDQEEEESEEALQMRRTRSLNRHAVSDGECDEPVVQNSTAVRPEGVKYATVTHRVSRSHSARNQEKTLNHTKTQSIALRQKKKGPPPPPPKRSSSAISSSNSNLSEANVQQPTLSTSGGMLDVPYHQQRRASDLGVSVESGGVVETTSVGSVRSIAAMLEMSSIGGGPKGMYADTNLVACAPQVGKSRETVGLDGEVVNRRRTISGPVTAELVAAAMREQPLSAFTPHSVASETSPNQLPSLITLPPRPTPAQREVEDVPSLETTPTLKRRPRKTQPNGTDFTLQESSTVKRRPKSRDKEPEGYSEVSMVNRRSMVEGVTEQPQPQQPQMEMEPPPRRDSLDQGASLEGEGAPVRKPKPPVSPKPVVAQIRRQGANMNQAQGQSASNRRVPLPGPGTDTIPGKQEDPSTCLAQASAAPHRTQTCQTAALHDQPLLAEPRPHSGQTVLCGPSVHLPSPSEPDQHTQPPNAKSLEASFVRLYLTDDFCLSLSSIAEQKSTVSILDDIGSMFDDLADQLDAMLE
uniref:CASK interacting protein 1 n=1 Tax=Neogobius melanostomus TaxID=47308 RepID=A0A8C6T572_9GOBI